MSDRAKVSLNAKNRHAPVLSSWRPKSSKSETTSQIMTRFFNPENMLLEDQPYYHGALPRQDIEDMLREEGEYLVREGDNGHILSVRGLDGQCYHFVVDRTDKGNICEFRVSKDGHIFPHIPALVSYYTESHEPLQPNLPKVILKKAKFHESWEITGNTPIEIHEQLGSGEYGTVHRGFVRLAADNKRIEVAIKMVKDCSKEMKQRLTREAHVMRQYNCKYIVKLIGIAASHDPLMILMEFVRGPNLRNYLRENKGKVTAKQKLLFAVMAARGMRYLERKKCIHRDLAARNCMIDFATITLKITDFGLSRRGGEYEMKTKATKVPIPWTAPEALKFRKFDSKSDVWSFGVLLCEIFSDGAIPYSEIPLDKLQAHIKAGNIPKIPESIPSDVCAVMMQCFQFSPKNRPTFEAIDIELSALYVKEDTVVNSSYKNKLKSFRNMLRKSTKQSSNGKSKFQLSSLRQRSAPKHL